MKKGHIFFKKKTGTLGPSLPWFSAFPSLCSTLSAEAGHVSISRMTIDNQSGNIRIYGSRIYIFSGKIKLIHISIYA
jgi:hypothetical protein